MYTPNYTIICICILSQKYVYLYMYKLEKQVLNRDLFNLLWYMYISQWIQINLNLPEVYVYCVYPAVSKTFKTTAKLYWKVDRETSDIAIVLKASARNDSSTICLCIKDEYSKNLSYHKYIHVPLLHRRYNNYRISVDINTCSSIYMYLHVYPFSVNSQYTIHIYLNWFCCW